MKKDFKGFMKGVNLGGWMSHGHYDPEHLATFITEEDVRRISGWDIDHVRIPVDYNLFEEENGTEGIGYEVLNRGIEWCDKYGINVIIDLHQAAGFSYEPAFGESGLFQSEKYQQRFYDLWESFAVRYGNRPDHIAFELLNEITDPEYIPAWNQMVATVLKVIRKHAPETKVLVGSYYNNAVEALPALELPDDKNLVLNFHCYDPIAFTHQKAYWMPCIRPDYELEYPCSKEKYLEIQREHPGLLPLDDPSGHPDFDVDYFIQRFAPAAALAEEKGLPLYCGEYGAIDRTDEESALRWHNDIQAAFEYHGIGRAAWSYKQMDFGIIDRPLLEKNIRF